MSTITWLDSCPSTNSVLAALPAAEHGTVVAARTQSAGRGQRGNKWESQPGANLTFSILLKPEQMHAARQFELSMLVSVCITDFLDALLAQTGSPLRASIKWPNDIYVSDSKICGILIENTLEGTLLGRSIAGIGININQTEFLSDAPNPVSLRNITGLHYDLEPLLDHLATDIATRVGNYSETQLATLSQTYHSRLWRRQGEWPFRRADGSEFTAEIIHVEPSGILHLSDGRRYAFKEVAFVL